MAGREYSDMIALRVRPSQRTLFEAAAKADGTSLSAWARKTLHAAARDQFRELLRGADPGAVTEARDEPEESSEQRLERLREALETA